MVACMGWGSSWKNVGGGLKSAWLSSNTSGLGTLVNYWLAWRPKLTKTRNIVHYNTRSLGLTWRKHINHSSQQWTSLVCWLIPTAEAFLTRNVGILSNKEYFAVPMDHKLNSLKNLCVSCYAKLCWACAIGVHAFALPAMDDNKFCLFLHESKAWKNGLEHMYLFNSYQQLSTHLKVAGPSRALVVVCSMQSRRAKRVRPSGLCNAEVLIGGTPLVVLCVGCKVFGGATTHCQTLKHVPTPHGSMVSCRSSWLDGDLMSIPFYNRLFPRAVIKSEHLFVWFIFFAYLSSIPVVYSIL